jgi:hypothetical protein
MMSGRRRLGVVLGVAVLAAIWPHAAGQTSAASGMAESPARTAGFKYDYEVASEDFLRAVVGCERRKLACPGATEAVVLTAESDNLIRVFAQSASDRRLKRPRLSNGRKESVRLLSIRELQQLVSSDPAARALHYVVQFSSPSRAHVSVVYQSLFHFGALTVAAGACGQSEYAIRKERKGWVCGGGGAVAKQKPRSRPRRR